mmetsp:Transcript_61989/g.103042  ORF Transcript_61989/g.103042 Transcript_61989/m.103042 type:complete len:348 (+) Transcript_61989:25-1068(+)|eukprot:CAMPEP_0119307274 /NCGR_PEP_ID=MMETSP1333-20130426/7821_1 /TAXON_ID=418940 /ORGANISM="Scyphosphaera apsteinii, Strain RCC1455" /LENGTH=347 /DNA_ID=CAMNT_0007310781 /DNA_START=19 /DNA_END=1062 /DNA_ORIENTATION=+
MLWLGLLSQAQPALDAIDVQNLFFGQQQFHDRLAESRWRAHEMDYLDGLQSEVLRHPYALVFDPLDGTMFVASFTLNHVVRLRVDSVTRKTAQYKVFVSGSELDGPVGMVISNGSLFVASFTNDRILRIDKQTGALQGSFGNDEELDCPEGIAMGPDGTLFVSSFLKQHITRYSIPNGEYLGDFAPRKAIDGTAVVQRAPQMHGPEDLTFDWQGDLHVTAYHSNSVFKFNGTTGEYITSYGKGSLRGPVGIACGPDDGDLYVSSYKTNQVLRFTSEGRLIGVAAGTNLLEQNGPQASSRRRNPINSPSGLAFDPHDGTMYVLSYVVGTLARFNNSALPVATHWRVTQ